LLIYDTRVAGKSWNIISRGIMNDCTVGVGAPTGMFGALFLDSSSCTSASALSLRHERIYTEMSQLSVGNEDTIATHFDVAHCY
jgi:hypothetical protein